MCGIVGAVSKSNVVDTLIEGLRRLEYRGYDSCGFAVINTSKPVILCKEREQQRVWLI